MSTATERRELVRPDATIAYWVSGPEDATTVVLLHGATLDHHAWAAQVEALAGRYRTVTPDLRGHGESTMTGSFRFADAVADVAALLDAVDTGEPLVLGGLSLGGNLAQEIVYREPERVDALVVADSTCNTAPRHPLAVPLTVATLSALVIGGRGRFLRNAAAATSPREDVRRYVLDANESRTAGEVVRILSSLLDSALHPDPAYRLPVPTLLLHGAEDRIGDIVAGTRDWAAREPTAVYEVIPDAGHASNQDNPEAFTAALESFLDQVVPSAAASLGLQRGDPAVTGLEEGHPAAASGGAPSAVAGFVAGSVGSSGLERGDPAVTGLEEGHPAATSGGAPSAVAGFVAGSVGSSGLERGDPAVTGLEEGHPAAVGAAAPAPAPAPAPVPVSVRARTTGLARGAAERLRSTLIRRGRVPGLRTAKVTFAVIAAYLLATLLGLSDHPIVAPLVALLVVQLTLYQSLAHGLGKVGGVVAGVGIAVLVAQFAGLTWWSLGVVVAGSIVLGRVLRLGAHLFEAPITAMLLLEVGGGSTLGLARVEEAVLGAGVGIAVSLLVAPPLYLQPAGAAIGELAERMARFTRGFAAGVRGPWSRGAADRWMAEARDVGAEVGHAVRTVARAEEAARLNPRGRRGRDAHPRMRSTLTALERCHVTLRTLARAVLDRTYFVPAAEQSAAYTAPQRAAVGDLLAVAADAIEAAAPIAGGGPAADAARERVGEHLAVLDERRTQLASVLAVDPAVDEAAWSQHGSLLAAVDRLRVEIAAAVQEVEPRVAA